MQGIAANDRLQPFAAVWALTFRDRHGAFWWTWGWRADGAAEGRRLRQPLRLEHGGNCLAIPPEDETLHGSCWPNASRSEDRHALPSFAANAVVGDSIGAFLTEIGAEPLRAGVVGGRVRGFELAMPVPQVVEVRTADWSVQHVEVEVLRGSARRFQKHSAMMLHLRDRRRFVSRRVVHAERWSTDRRWSEARSVRRRIREWRHDVAGAGTVDALLGRNLEGGSDPVAHQRIRPRAQRQECVEILRIRDVLEQIYRWENCRYELYSFLPRQPLWCELSPFFRRGCQTVTSLARRRGARKSGIARSCSSASSRSESDRQTLVQYWGATPSRRASPHCAEREP